MPQYTTDGTDSSFEVGLRDDVLQRLRGVQSQLQSQGILHAAVFGSVARCEASPDSDVDILVDLDPRAKIDLFQFVGLQQFLAAVMERQVDLVSRKGLRPRRHDSILHDAIEVF